MDPLPLGPPFQSKAKVLPGLQERPYLRSWRFCRSFRGAFDRRDILDSSDRGRQAWDSERWRHGVALVRRVIDNEGVETSVSEGRRNESCYQSTHPRSPSCHFVKFKAFIPVGCRSFQDKGMRSFRFLSSRSRSTYTGGSGH